MSLLAASVFGQTNFEQNNLPTKHQHHKNQIAVANSPVYFIKEKTFSYGLHFHYIKKSLESKFGIGIGYERIFDKHKHNTFGIVGA